MHPSAPFSVHVGHGEGHLSGGEGWRAWGCHRGGCVAPISPGRGLYLAPNRFHPRFNLVSAARVILFEILLPLLWQPVFERLTPPRQLALPVLFLLSVLEKRGVFITSTPSQCDQRPL